MLGGLFLTHSIYAKTREIMRSLKKDKKVHISSEFLLERYGAGSWVIVTGAGSTTGEALCRELARIGFSVVLIDHDKEKLVELAQRLKQLNPAVKTKVIEYDFNFISNCDDIFVEIEDLDVSVLINNAEIKSLQYFSHQSDKEIDELISHNIFSQVFMTKQFIKSIKENPRAKKSAIVTVSSNAVFMHPPFLSSYAPTKRFNLVFSECVREEVDPEKLDVLTVLSGFVAADASDFVSGAHFISAEEFVRGVLGNLGRNNFAYANHVHEDEVSQNKERFEVSWRYGAHSIFSLMQKIYQRRRRQH